jgi:hypothetical protein
MSQENVGIVRQGFEEFQAVELHMALLYELENGQVIRMRNFLDPADALKAAGLRE